jgi:hypothetical protein
LLAVDFAGSLVLAFFILVIFPQTRFSHLGQVSIDFSVFHPQLAQTQRYGRKTATPYLLYWSVYAELSFLVAVRATPREVSGMGAVLYE